MKTSVVIRASIAVAIVLTATAAAAPASAAGRTLPAGQSLYTYACGEVPLEVYSVDSTTAASTPIGSGTPAAEGACGYDPAYNWVTGKAYGLVSVGSSQSVGLIDLVTGLTSSIVPLTSFEEPVFIDSLTFDLEGNAYATSGLNFYSVDVNTGVTGFIGTLPGVDAATYALATNPVDGLIYAFEEFGDLYTIDPTDASTEYLDTFSQADVSNVWGLDIDASGVLWFVTNQGSGDPGVPGLWSSVATDLNGSAIESGQLLTGGEFYYTFTALIAPAPALAATGFDAAPLLAGAVALGLAGIVLVSVRRRTTSA